MTAIARQWVAPLYLFACLLLGGSAQSIWGNAALQLTGLALIAWGAIERPGAGLSRKSRQLALLTMAAIAWVLLQLVPLPPSLWSALGPRAGLIEAYQLLGMPAPALPLSVAPFATVATLLALIPPIAIYVAIDRLHAYRTAYLAAALAAGTLASILLGLFQVSSPDPLTSPFYLYRDVNFGVATGFFANANHMASLLLATLPFLAALAAGARLSARPQSGAVVTGAGALALVVIVGVVLNGSLAAFLLLPAVLVASALILFQVGSGMRRASIVLSALLLAGGAVALNLTAIGAQTVGADAADSVSSRPAIFTLTARAARDYMPFGSGLGTYRHVYDGYEDPAQVSTVHSSHAHNDYAELSLELGLPGIILILLFGLWWASSAIESWRSPEPDVYARAAAVATAAILAHSLVDYPLRTAAMSAIFAMGLAFLAARAKVGPYEVNALRPARHLALD